MNIKILTVSFLLTLASCGLAKVDADIPQVTTETYTLGDMTVLLKIVEYGPGPIFYALHENESTSVTAAGNILPNYGGTVIEVLHGGGRRISFTMQGRVYSFDPNRIFSDRGIRATLGSGYSAEAHSAVATLSNALVRHLEGGPVIALHNNTNASYSIASYQAGGQYETDAAQVNRVPGVDVDNFFFTTESYLFSALSAKGFNVVLQSKNVRDDGSLSVYAAQKNIPYVNVEAQHGSVAAQQQMLVELLNIM